MVIGTLGRIRYCGRYTVLYEIWYSRRARGGRLILGKGGGGGWVGIRLNEKVSSVQEAFIKNISRRISFRNLTRWDQV